MDISYRLLDLFEETINVNKADEYTGEQNKLTINDFKEIKEYLSIVSDVERIESAVEKLNLIDSLKEKFKKTGDKELISIDEIRKLSKNINEIKQMVEKKKKALSEYNKILYTTINNEVLYSISQKLDTWSEYITQLFSVNYSKFAENVEFAIDSFCKANESALAVDSKAYWIKSTDEEPYRVLKKKIQSSIKLHDDGEKILFAYIKEEFGLLAITDFGIYFESLLLKHSNFFEWDKYAKQYTRTDSAYVLLEDEDWLVIGLLNHIKVELVKRFYPEKLAEEDKERDTKCVSVPEKKVEKKQTFEEAVEEARKDPSWNERAVDDTDSDVKEAPAELIGTTIGVIAMMLLFRWRGWDNWFIILLELGGLYSIGESAYKLGKLRKWGGVLFSIIAFVVTLCLF